MRSQREVELQISVELGNTTVGILTKTVAAKELEIDALKAKLGEITEERDALNKKYEPAV